MTICEAIEVLRESVDINKSIFNEMFGYTMFDTESEAIELLISEYLNLRKEVTRLAIESIEREKILARLEAEVAQLRDYKVIESVMK